MGVEPGAPPNSYGPLHNSLSLAVVIHFLAPKLLMVSAFVFMSALFVRYLLRQRIAAEVWIAYALLIPLNVVTISVVAIHGDNDALVASFVGLALVAKFSGRPFLTGILIGLGTLLKFYPILLIPFFAKTRNTFSWHTINAALVTLLLGFSVTFLIWDTQVFAPLSFGATRPPTLISPLAWLETLDVRWLRSVVDSLLLVNSFLVLAALVVSFFVTRLFRLSWIEGSVIGFFYAVVTYKVGHVQFYLVWLVLLSALLTGDKYSRRLVLVFVPFVIYLQLIQLLLYMESNALLVTPVTTSGRPGLALLILVMLTTALLSLWLRGRVANQPITLCSGESRP